MNIRITRIGFEIHPTVGKRAKRMPDATVETTVALFQKQSFAMFGAYKKNNEINEIKN